MKTSVVVADSSFRGNTAPITGSWDEVTRQAAEIGYDGIQLTVNRPRDINAANILRATNRYGLAVSSIATGMGYTVDGLSLGVADESVRKAAVQRMREHVELAARLGGARVIIGAIRGWARDSGGWEIFEGRFRSSVEELLTYAEQMHVVLLLEANDHLETDAYLSVKETADFIAGYHSPHFRLQLDTMHLLYENEPFYEEIHRVAPLIAQVDLSDLDRMAPDGKHFDFPLLIQALREIDYQDWMVFEFRPSPPYGAAKAGLEYIMGLVQGNIE